AIGFHFPLQYSVVSDLARLIGDERGLSRISARQQFLAPRRILVFVLDSADDIGAFPVEGSLKFLDLSLNLLHAVMFRCERYRHLRQLNSQVRQLGLKTTK